LLGFLFLKNIYTHNSRASNGTTTTLTSTWLTEGIFRVCKQYGFIIR